MGAMKTPGVYIVEKNAFPNSVVEVATAVPAFIGYTEKADNKGKSLTNKPWRIASMSEFHAYFGFGPSPAFSVVEKAANTKEEAAFSAGGKQYLLQQEKGKYLLYYSMLLFYQNGGGPCYVVSVGDYTSDVEADKLRQGVDLLIKEQEPTMVVIPDTMLLVKEGANLKPEETIAEAIAVQQAALAHCGGKMKNRVAILDVPCGYRSRQDPAFDPIDEFRNALGINNLDYGVAYYPWVNTTVVQDRDLSYENIVNMDVLQALLKKELNLPEAVDDHSRIA